MFIDHWARETPDCLAIQMAGSGEAVTFAELERLGLELSAVIANHPNRSLADLR